MYQILLEFPVKKKIQISHEFHVKNTNTKKNSKKTIQSVNKCFLSPWSVRAIQHSKQVRNAKESTSETIESFNKNCLLLLTFI